MIESFSHNDKSGPRAIAHGPVAVIVNSSIAKPTPLAAGPRALTNDTANLKSATLSQAAFATDTCVQVDEFNGVPAGFMNVGFQVPPPSVEYQIFPPPNQPKQDLQIHIATKNLQ